MDLRLGKSRFLPKAANFKGRQIFEDRKDKFLMTNLTILHEFLLANTEVIFFFFTKFMS